MLIEVQLVKLFPFEQLHFVREGQTPKNGFQVAYSLDQHENIVREWFLYHEWIDGVEAFNPTGRMVRSDITLNQPSVDFDPRLATICPRKPVKLCDRWAVYHRANPRIINISLWQRLKQFFEWRNTL